jgi:hypothetical protein
MASLAGQQLQGTEGLNEGLSFYYGHANFRGKPLSLNLEKPQLFFKATGCSPGQQHYRLITPKALQKPKDLQCRLCNPEMVDVGTEVAFIERGQEAGFLKDIIWQWQPADPKWWHGRVDFLHHPTMTLIQIDGSAHFERYRSGQPGQQLQRDMQFNKAAWDRGERVLRIHHADLPECHQVLQPCFNKPGPFLAFSCSYVHQGWQHAGKQVRYLEAMAEQLGCRCYCNMDCRAVVWLTM